MSWEMKSGWEVLAGITAATVLAVSLYVDFIRPQIRKRRLKHPCKAYFHIRELRHGELGYALQDDRAHNVKELVLPSNSLVEIEVSYYPRINFNVEETVFGCEGDRASKPEAEMRVTRFIEKGKSEWIPGIDDSDTINRKGYYHVRARFAARAIGSCYTMGFKLRTKNPGIYKASLGFVTDEIDGTADDLQIRVEDKPSTRMRCTEHWGCRIRPIRMP